MCTFIYIYGEYREECGHIIRTRNGLTGAVENFSNEIFYIIYIGILRIENFSNEIFLVDFMYIYIYIIYIYIYI